MLMADSPQFVVVYLAAMRMGAIPVPVSTMLHADGRGRAAGRLAGPVAGGHPGVRRTPRVAAAGRARADRDAGRRRRACPQPRCRCTICARTLAAAALDEAVYPTTADSPAFWLYTSGTTGMAKAAMHRHGSVQVVCETYGRAGARHPAGRPVPVRGQGVLRLRPGQFAAVPVVGRARPACWNRRRPGPTLIAGAGAASTAPPCSSPGRRSSPTCCAPSCPPTRCAGVRLAASAGEALPASLYERWTRHFGVDILDGIGMTEMLHIFLSNRPGEVRPGTTGVAVPGYDLRLLDEDGDQVPGGHAGHAVRPRRLGRDRVLVPVRRLPPGVPGGVAAHRRHLRPGRPTATTPASAAPATCSRPAACGCPRPRWRPGCWPTRRWPRRSWWPRTTPTGWKNRSPTSSCSPGDRPARTN